MDIILSVFRLCIGIALFFFIPGLILTILLFPRKNDLHSLERTLIAVISSILISMTAATFLLIASSLNFTTLTLSMLIITAAVAVPGYVRWRGVTQSDQVAILRRDNPVLLPLVAATICLVLALSGVTLLLYPHANEISYSELYLLDANRTTVAYPTNLTQGAVSALILGITNHENITNTYSGTVSLNNTTIDSFDNLTLRQGQNVERPIVVSFNLPGEKQKLQFTLTDSLNKTYELHLWVNVTKGA